MRGFTLSRAASAAAIVAALASVGSARADTVEVYGDQDVLGTGTYASDPTAGATLVGLAPGVVTFATLITPHGFPFSPEGDDLAGTDQIYAGAFSYVGGDGYSNALERINGAQVINVDYSALVPEGQTVDSLTLGIAADDFQYPVFANPYTAVVNDQIDPVLSSTLNGLDQTNPNVQFFTIGIGNIRADNTLTLVIRQASGVSRGDPQPQGDGWAIDFLTIGITTVPSQGTMALAGLAGLVSLRRRR